MDIFKPIKNAIKKVREHVDNIEKEREEQEKIEKWKKRLTDAISKHDAFRADCAAWDAQYHGTKEVGSSIGKNLVSDRDKKVTKDARQVVNITLQLIESQIDISVPKPNVEPTEFDNNDPMEQERQRMVEGMLHYMGSGTTLQRINSENERIVKKNSYAIFKVGYNPKVKSHKWIGKIETTNPHPCNFIPQPGIHRIEDMDYCFHVENRTLDYICRTYGEEFREQLEGEKAEYAYLDELSEARTENDETLSVVECWYKDKDGDVCLLTWCNEVVLRDEPKFFYKRNPDGSLIEYDEIEIEQPPIDDGMGNLIPQPSQIVKVPIHVPKRFPFVVQYNIPKEKSFYGKSDPEIIYDQQEAIKKVLSDHEEKLIKGTTKIFVRKGTGLTNKINNAQLQVIETEDPNNDIKVVDLKTPENSLLEYYSVMLRAAKDVLGVTEASQGRTDDGTDLSGRALEILAANTAGRLAVKQFEKDMAYTELYQLYYDFLLAFYDDPRPYRVDGEDGKPIYGFWDKSKLIKQDAAGEWYYPEYDIYISVDMGLPKDKRFIMEAASRAENRLDNIEYWQIMESIGFPNASAILKREQEKEGVAQQEQQLAPSVDQQLLDDIVSQMTPEEMELLRNDPQAQQAVLERLGGGINA